MAGWMFEASTLEVGGMPSLVVVGVLRHGWVDSEASTFALDVGRRWWSLEC